MKSRFVRAMFRYPLDFPVDIPTIRVFVQQLPSIRNMRNPISVDKATQESSQCQEQDEAPECPPPR
jgi:hypothetical protein